MASSDHVVRPVEIERPPNNEYPPLQPQTQEDDNEEETNLFTVLHELADRVNRTAWNGVTWSKTGDYVVGGKQIFVCDVLRRPLDANDGSHRCRIKGWSFDIRLGSANWICGENVTRPSRFSDRRSRKLFALLEIITPLHFCSHFQF